MRLKLIPVLALLLVPVASASPPAHPSRVVHHRTVVRLCDRAEFTMRVPRDERKFWVDEWVNGHEISAWTMGNTVWFFGRGVSGRSVQSGTLIRVQVVRHAPGCVRFVLAWWPR